MATCNLMNVHRVMHCIEQTGSGWNRLGVGEPSRKEDDQQGGQHYHGGHSSAVHAQLHVLSGL